MLTVTAGDPAANGRRCGPWRATAAGVIVVGSDGAASEECGRWECQRCISPPTVAPAGDCVLGDDITGGRLAAEHLLGLGHGVSRSSRVPRPCSRGGSGWPGTGWVCERPGSSRMSAGNGDLAVSGRRGRRHRGADRAARARRPTALIIANHEAGYGALPALRERSVAVPAELSVVCYEDSPLARWWHPR